MSTSVVSCELLEACQQSIGYRFNDLELLAISLLHSSIAPSRLESNERLEFLGDAVLGLVICEELFRRFSEHLEGELTKLKSAIVSRRSCAQVADRLKLADYLVLGKGMHGRSHLPQSMPSAAIESAHLRNFKSVLQQFAQRELAAGPYYEVLDEKGPDHSKCFEVCVTIAHRRFASAWGPSKKEAEQLAARLALRELAGEYNDPMLKV